MSKKNLSKDEIRRKVEDAKRQLVSSVSEVSQADLGNNQSKSGEEKKKSYRARRWCFTLYDCEEEIKRKEFIEACRLKCLTSFIGLETCPTTGKMHLQGYLEAKNQIRGETLNGLWKGFWTAARGNRKDCIKYCSKEKIIHNDFKEEDEEELDLITDEMLFDWQKEIIEMCNEKPDKRKIYWYYEKTGNRGKTEFTKYMCHHYNAVPLEGKKADILMIAQAHPSKIYIYDIERSLEDYISYASMEKIKGGLYMSGKYEGGIVIRNNPHLIIFANFPPDITKLSKDRWVIRNLDENTIVEVSEED